MRAEWRPVHDYNAEGDKMYDVMAVTDKNNVQGDLLIVINQLYVFTI